MRTAPGAQRERGVTGSPWHRLRAAPAPERHKQAIPAHATPPLGAQAGILK